MIVYDKLFTALRNAGFTTYKIRKEKLMGNATWARVRKGEGDLEMSTLDRLCDTLGCQPGDLIEYKPNTQ